MLCTSLAPSLKSMAGRFTAAGAAIGVSWTCGGGATFCTGGGGASEATFGVSAGLGGSTFGSGGFSLGGSGFFSFGAMVTVISFSFLPSMPSRVLKDTMTTTSAPWKISERVRLTLEELVLRRLIAIPFGDRHRRRARWRD